MHYMLDLTKSGQFKMPILVTLSFNLASIGILIFQNLLHFQYILLENQDCDYLYVYCILLYAICLSSSFVK